MDPARQAELDQTRESLLDVVLDRLHKAGKATIISRLIYVARFSKRETNADSQGDQLLKILSKHDQEFTGLLLVYPACCIHLLEAKMDSIMAVLREINSPNSTLNYAETRVIASTEDIPSRCFNAWRTAYVASGSSVDVMEAIDPAQLVSTATTINTFLRSLGSNFVTLPDADLRRRLASMEQFYEELPAMEVVLTLVPAEDAPTVSEFLEIYDSPVNVDLDSEQVWPIPATLKY